MQERKQNATRAEIDRDGFACYFDAKFGVGSQGAQLFSVSYLDDPRATACLSVSLDGQGETVPNGHIGIEKFAARIPSDEKEGEDHHRSHFGFPRRIG
jgi:hypothetical protein